MAGMGPVPKPAGTRQRRNATVAMTTLPSAGRVGNCPDWPLPDDVMTRVLVERAEAKVADLRDQLNDASMRSAAKLEREIDRTLTHATVLERELATQREMESALWAELWSTPQAHAWEQLGWVRDVAQYVRHKVRAELGSLDDAKEARQWSDRLGLNPLAMLRLRWETERTEEAEHRGRQRRQQPKRSAKKASSDPRGVLRAV